MMKTSGASMICTATVPKSCYTDRKVFNSFDYMDEGFRQQHSGEPIRVSVGIGKAALGNENTPSIALTSDTVIEYLESSETGRRLGFSQLMDYLNGLDSSKHPPANRPGKFCHAWKIESGRDYPDHETRRVARESLYALAQELNMRGKTFMHFADCDLEGEEVEEAFIKIQEAGREETDETKRSMLKRQAARDAIKMVVG